MIFQGTCIFNFRRLGRMARMHIKNQENEEILSKEPTEPKINDFTFFSKYIKNNSVKKIILER